MFEFTPRDDKGGDLDLEFNEHTLTWNSVTSPNEDYKNSSIIRWIICTLTYIREEDPKNT